MSEDYKEFEAWFIPLLREHEKDVPEEFREVAMNFSITLAYEAWKEAKKR